MDFFWCDVREGSNFVFSPREKKLSQCSSPCPSAVPAVSPIKFLETLLSVSGFYFVLLGYLSLPAPILRSLSYVGINIHIFWQVTSISLFFRAVLGSLLFHVNLQ